MSAGRGTERTTRIDIAVWKPDASGQRPKDVTVISQEYVRGDDVSPKSPTWWPPCACPRHREVPA